MVHIKEASASFFTSPTTKGSVCQHRAPRKEVILMENIKHHLALFVAMLMEDLGYSKATIDQVTALIEHGN